MKKKKKLSLYGFLFLLAILIAAFFFLGRYADRVIDPYVRSLLEVTKPMGHKIDYKKIRVNLFGGSIIIKEVRVFPDSSLTLNDLRMEINVNDIKLTGFSIRQIVFDKSLTIEKFLIENPEVKLILPDSANKVVKTVREEKVQKKGGRLLTKINLEKISLSGGSFQLIHNQVILAKSTDINLLVQSISLASNNKEEPIGYTYGDISLNLSDIELYSETGLYDMSLGGFSFTKSDSTLVLNGFRMIPKFDKKEFSGKLKFQGDRFDVKIGEVNIGRVGIEKFLAGGTLEITSVTIDSLDADIYRDKNVAFNFNRFPPFYNESFLKIPIPVYIDTLLITSSKILYGELAEGRPVAGTILLENLNIQSYDLTNQVAEDTIDHVMKLNVQALVMGEGTLNVELKLPLEGNLHDFECSGSVGSMQLSPLNDMLEPAINMKFNGGKVNRMTFNFAANDKTSKGWMEFLYQDLDVALMKKDPEKEWGLVSTLANTMTLSNNPAPGKNLKIVEIGFERDKNKGIINYVWKTIQSGMIHTILPIKKYQINRKKDMKEQDQGKNSEKKRNSKKK
jgi:hypothetical protein